MKVTRLWKETIDAVLKSKQLLVDTLAGKADVVADCIRRVHEQNSSVLNYNNEQSLRFIVLIAYYYAREQYNIIQELPAGEGSADIVFIPKPFTDANASYIKEVYGEDTLFPDDMESVPKKYAISKRNDWMIQHSSFAICYVHKITGGAAKFREKAEKKGLQIIDVQ